MSVHYKDTKYATRKNSKCEKIKMETQPSFKPKINSNSREIDKSMNSQQSPLSRIDNMISYAEKYDNHKLKLKEKYNAE